MQLHTPFKFLFEEASCLVSNLCLHLIHLRYSFQARSSSLSSTLWPRWKSPFLASPLKRTQVTCARLRPWWSVICWWRMAPLCMSMTPRLLIEDALTEFKYHDLEVNKKLGITLDLDGNILHHDTPWYTMTSWYICSILSHPVACSHEGIDGSDNGLENSADRRMHRLSDVVVESHWLLGGLTLLPTILWHSLLDIFEEGEISSV